MPSLEHRSLVLALLAGMAVPLRAQEAMTDSVNPVPEPVEEAKAAPVLPEVAVEGEKAVAVGSGKIRVDTVTTGTLGRQRLQDVPRSVSVSTARFIQDQQAQYVQDVLRTNPTVTHTSGTNTVGGGATFSLRGFSSGTTELIDGMVANSRVPVEDKERIEVLNGPASFLYGIGSPGGSINYVLKRPTDTSLLHVTAGDYGGRQAYVLGDVGGPLWGGKLGYRADVLYVDDGGTGIKGQSHERNLQSAAIDWNIAPGVKWSVDASSYFIDVEHGDDNFSLGSKVKAIPAAPDAAANYMPTYSSAKDWADRVGTSLSAQVASFLAVRGDLRFVDKELRRHRAAITITNDAGDFTMSRNYYDTETFYLQGDAFADANFTTLGVSHSATVGVVGSQSIAKYGYPYANGSVKYGGTNNIYDLKPWPADSVGDASHDADMTSAKTWTTTGILSDRLDFGARWSLALGVAYAAIDAQTWDLSKATKGTVAMKPEYDKGEFTPTASLRFRPLPTLTTYLTYAEGLEQGPTAPGTASNANETLDPYLTRLVEAGAKARLLGLDLSSALFWTTRANAYTDATNTYVEDGRQVDKGFELFVDGTVGSHLTVGGGFTILSAEVTKTGDDSLEGKVAAGVPEQVAKVYGEFALPFFPRLSVNGDVAYTGKIYASADNALSIPSVVVGDMGLRFVQPVRRHQVILRVRVTNIADKNYWQSAGSGLTLGSPRTFSGSATFNL